MVSTYRIHRSTTPNFAPSPNNLIGQTTDSTFQDDNPNFSQTQYYKVVEVDGQGNLMVMSGEIKNTDMLFARVNVKVFLEGPYNANTLSMNTTLNATLRSRWPNLAVPSNAVDSVNIEVRNTQFGGQSSIRKFRPAWLLSDGTIRKFDDTTKQYVEYNDAPAGDYHVVVHHRNHLSVMSSVIRNFYGVEPVNAVDFTQSASSAFGTNALKQVGTRFVLVSGDANNNGQVATSDINNVIRPSIGQSGYRNGDTNLNGQVTNSDINLYVKPNVGRGTQVPSAPTIGGNGRKKN